MIKAVIFDWGRTLYDSEKKVEFVESEEILEYIKSKGLRMALASLVSAQANATLEERKRQIANSPLWKYFEYTRVTDGDKNQILEEIVAEINMPREEILIVDDRMIRGIKYGNLNGHPTAWVKAGKFSEELPTAETLEPTYVINNVSELKNII